jgi:hypothetical protein
VNDKRTCGNCRWWSLEDEETQVGLCQRRAPSPMIAINTDGELASAYWPACLDGHFCGEWRDKSITPEQEQRSELVERFALAIVSSDEDVTGGRWKPDTVWRMAADYVDAKPKIGGES